MSEPHVPQPRYSAEHKEQARAEGMPLFTFDILHYPGKRRTTVTGVLNSEDAAHVIGMIQRALGKDPHANGE